MKKVWIIIFSTDFNYYNIFSNFFFKTQIFLSKLLRFISLLIQKIFILLFYILILINIFFSSFISCLKKFTILYSNCFVVRAKKVYEILFSTYLDFHNVFNNYVFFTTIIFLSYSLTVILSLYKKSELLFSPLISIIIMIFYVNLFLWTLYFFNMHYST